MVRITSQGPRWLEMTRDCLGFLAVCFGNDIMPEKKWRGRGVYPLLELEGIHFSCLGVYVGSSTIKRLSRSHSSKRYAHATMNFDETSLVISRSMGLIIFCSLCYKNIYGRRTVLLIALSTGARVSRAPGVFRGFPAPRGFYAGFLRASVQVYRGITDTVI